MVKFENKYGRCPVHYTLSQLEGKWKWIILWQIHEAGVVRYNKLKETLSPVAHKTLSQQLKEMEAGGLIHREQYNQVPPKVEYSLTEKGKTLLPILNLMNEWGKANMIAEKLEVHKTCVIGRKAQA